MRVVGCDCSTKLIGCSMLDGDFASARLLVSQSPDMIVRANELFFQFRDLLIEWQPDAVFVEQAIYLQNIKVTLGIDAVIQGVRYNSLIIGVYCHIVDNKSWKKDIIGSGKASKEQIMEFSKLKWGNLITNQDVADSLCIALYGQRRL